MKVKRFTAEDMSSALDMVRKALGPQAVILSTGELPSGGVEVSAAVDQDAGARLPASSEPASSAAVAALARRVENLGTALNRHLVRSEAAAAFSARPEVAPLYHHLSRQEVSPAIIAELLDGLGHPEGRGILPRLTIRIKKALKVGPSLRLKEGGPVVWALVGPTGVGKTTTCAKLAATFGLKHRIKVGMITLDTYRMAAPEQLKAYGRIMEVPTLVAAGAEQLKGALASLDGCDLVLVDTVGRSPEDDESLAELKDVLTSVPDICCHLVIAGPTRDADQELVLASFERFAPRSLIYTKLDETSTYGPILNQVKCSGLPVSWLTMGQRVPDDLEQATVDGLARRLAPRRRDLTLA